jgi:hypothetical protein
MKLRGSSPATAKGVLSRLWMASPGLSRRYGRMRHGLPGQARGTAAGTPPAPQRPASGRDRRPARSVQVERVPVGPGRGVHAPPPPSPGTATGAERPAAAEAGGDRSPPGRRAAAGRAAVGAGVPGRGRGPVCGGGCQAGWGGEVRQQRPADDRLLLRLATAVLPDRRDTAPVAAVPARRAGSGRLNHLLVRVDRNPPSQFHKPYRAVPDPSIRHTKHVHGCASIDYSCSATHRRIMGLVRALLSDAAIRGSSIGRAAAC